MKHFMKPLFAGLILAIFLTGCDDEEAAAPVSTESAATTLKKTVFTPVDLKGNTYHIEKHDKGLSFKELENTVVLTNFFTTWCPPCRAEIPHLNNLQERFPGEFKVFGFMMDRGKTLTDAKEFVTRFDVQFAVSYSAENQKIADAMGGVPNIPYMVMYDKQGNYFTHYVGVVPEEMLAADIERARKVQ